MTAVLVSAGCAGREQEQPGSLPVHVTVSILPQKYLVERIGGDRVRVQVMVRPGSSPATYEPHPAQMAALRQARLYFSIGVPFERPWLPRFRSTVPGLRVVDAGAGQARRSLPGHSHEEASAQGAPGELEDPHVWLSPRRLAAQAGVVAAALADVDPEGAPTYGANRVAFEEEVAALDRDIRTRLAGLDGQAFFVYHPSWGYFAEDYGLRMIPVEVGGQEPSAAELADFVAQARRHGGRVIFAQPEFTTAPAETLARAVDGRVVVISPLAEDWSANLLRMADALKAALTEAAPPAGEGAP